MRAQSKPGDGKPLRPYRWWQLFSRALFHIRLSDIDGTSHRWSVDVALWGDSDGEVVARLFRDDVNEASSKLPAARIPAAQTFSGAAVRNAYAELQPPAPRKPQQLAQVTR